MDHYYPKQQTIPVVRRIRPLHDNVVVYPSPKKEKSEGGVYLPDDARRPEITGTVLEVGPEVGGGISPGDKVVFPQYAGVEVRLQDKDNEEHVILIMPYKQVKAVIEE